MSHYLTIDVGGTQIKYALIHKDGTIENTSSRPTPQDSLEEFLDTIFAIIEPVKTDIQGVAFSIPGKVDTEAGVIYFGGALTYLDQLPLKQIIQERYGIKVALQNDAKAAALAEVWLGSLKGVHDGAVIVLGTGVGGGVVLDGKLRMGPHFQAGELSLGTLDLSKPGFEKMIGMAGSAVRMIETINKTLGNQDIKDGRLAFDAILSGNEQALAIFRDYCQQIAYLILNLQAFLDLTTYAIGGGISSQPIVIEEIKNQYLAILEANPVLKMNLPELTILPTTLKNEANLVGALYTLLTTQ